MRSLKQCSEPPIWLSESLALFFAGIAITAVASSLALWASVDFWKKLETGGKEPNVSAWVCEFLFLLATLGFGWMGAQAFLAGRFIKQRNANDAELVVGEMDENYNAQMDTWAKEEKEQKKRVKEQAALAKNQSSAEVSAKEPPAEEQPEDKSDT